MTTRKKDVLAAARKAAVRHMNSCINQHQWCVDEPYHDLMVAYENYDAERAERKAKRQCKWSEVCIYLRGHGGQHSFEMAHERGETSVGFGPKPRPRGKPGMAPGDIEPAPKPRIEPEQRYGR